LLLQNHRALLLDHLLFKDSPFFQVLGSHAHAFLLFLCHLLWHCAVPVCIYLTKNPITDPPPPLSPHKHPPLALTDNFFLPLIALFPPFSAGTVNNMYRLFLVAAIVASGVADLSKESIEQETQTEEARVQTRLNALQAESVQELVYLKEQKESKLKLLDQVKQLQLEKYKSDEALKTTQQQLQQQNDEGIKAKTEITAAKAMIEQQKKELNLLQTSNANLQQVNAETLATGQNIARMIKEDLPLPTTASSLLDEGNGAATTAVLLSNIQSSLTSMHERKVQQAAEKKRLAAKKVEQETHVDHRSAEERDMESFAGRLENLDESLPLMAQLGLED
jgi:hypothetical protein